MPHLHYLLEATYQDGYVYKGTQEDTSVFDKRRNAFFDVLEKLHEKKHGKLVSWAVVGFGKKHEIDMTKLPDNARPILYKDMERDFFTDNTGKAIDWVNEPRIVKWYFGAQWNDENGKNQKLIKELDLEIEHLENDNASGLQDLV